mgnify:CR=1 FL=1
MNFEEVKRQEQENLMPTYGRFPVALVYGKGAVAVDTEGKEYIDFTSGIGVNSLGYCDDGWVSAVAKQAGAIQHMSNLYYSPVQTSLAAELCRLTGFGRSVSRSISCFTISVCLLISARFVSTLNWILIGLILR